MWINGFSLFDHSLRIAGGSLLAYTHIELLHFCIEFWFVSVDQFHHIIATHTHTHWISWVSNLPQVWIVNHRTCTHSRYDTKSIRFLTCVRVKYSHVWTIIAKHTNDSAVGVPFNGMTVNLCVVWVFPLFNPFPRQCFTDYQIEWISSSTFINSNNIFAKTSFVCWKKVQSTVQVYYVYVWFLHSKTHVVILFFSLCVSVKIDEKWSKLQTSARSLQKQQSGLSVSLCVCLRVFVWFCNRAENWTSELRVKRKKRNPKEQCKAKPNKTKKWNESTTTTTTSKVSIIVIDALKVIHVHFFFHWKQFNWWNGKRQNEMNTKKEKRNSPKRACAQTHTLVCQLKKSTRKNEGK